MRLILAALAGERNPGMLAVLARDYGISREA
jgi:hypothetical protein